MTRLVTGALAGAITLLLLAPVPAAAQTTALLRGTIVDTQGAPCRLWTCG